ncbi:hypothetical protein ACFY8O_33905 [Streptomyces argenteolus]|uniref:Uncharacterized protein n=1 Tax=Streptomyces argenteolus TaxID=67274 RepID=A0ABW6XGJ8_9ACTN
MPGEAGGGCSDGERGDGLGREDLVAGETDAYLDPWHDRSQTAVDTLADADWCPARR